MSVFDEATVFLAVADYMAQDSGGKINALGLGFGVSGLQPHGQTGAIFIAAFVEAPRRFIGETASITLELRNVTDDEVVTAAGPTGLPEALRITQLVKFDPPNAPGIDLGEDFPVRIQVLLGFPIGLPLQAGKTYAWKLRIDERTRPGWQARFHVPATPPGPIIGGPAGPADIPNVTSLATEEQEAEE